MEQHLRFYQHFQHTQVKMETKPSIKNIEFKGLVISRITPQYKDYFKSLAKEEFCDDYGMTLVSLLKDSIEYNRLKEMFFNNQLNVKLLLDKPEQPNAQDQGPRNITGELIFNKNKKEEKNGKIR